MSRRELITLLGVTVAAPLAARAQQPEQVRRVGVLMWMAESDPEGLARVMAFQQSLQKLGWAEGRNIRIDYRWAAGDADRLQAFAKEIIELHPDVILTHTTLAVATLRRETATIPIVF